jgi:hypothetical protein
MPINFIEYRDSSIIDLNCIPSDVVYFYLWCILQDIKYAALNIESANTLSREINLKLIFWEMRVICSNMLVWMFSDLTWDAIEAARHVCLKVCLAMPRTSTYFPPILCCGHPCPLCDPYLHAWPWWMSSKEVNTDRRVQIQESPLLPLAYY